MTNKSKRKGYKAEYNLVKHFKKKGLSARRQPMSGALSDFPHDIQINNPNIIVEVKTRKNGTGFKTLKRWKGNAQALALHEDHEYLEKNLICVDLDFFIDLLLNHNEYRVPYDLEVKEKLKHKDC